MGQYHSGARLRPLRRPCSSLGRVAHLADCACESGRDGHDERAASLERSKPYADITPLVRDYLERAGSRKRHH